MKRRTEYEKILDFCDTGGHRFYGGVCGAVLHGTGLAAMAAALVAATVPYWDDLREPLPEEL